MRPGPGSAGFTLLEVLVVIVILALAAGIVLQRPVRSAALDLHGTAAGLARGLRLARAEAIVRNRPVLVRVDAPGHAYAVGDGPVQRLPEAFAVTLVSVAPGSGGATGISFAPDGSSSGGRIGLASGGSRVEVDVGWLTGRVSVSGVRRGDEG